VPFAINSNAIALYRSHAAMEFALYRWPQKPFCLPRSATAISATFCTAAFTPAPASFWLISDDEKAAAQPGGRAIISTAAQCVMPTSDFLRWLSMDESAFYANEILFFKSA